MDPFIAEVRPFAFSYAPNDWAQCNGQTAPISQYQALYSVIGNLFGGSYQANTMGLPNLQGSAVCHAGQKPTLTPRPFASTFGDSQVTLETDNIPNHNHDVQCLIPSTAAGSADTPTTTSHLSRTLNQLDFCMPQTADTMLSPQMVGNTGGAPVTHECIPHENRQPFLALNFCICLSGEYPIRP